MKGIILAGGYGTRLRPLTLVTNKHLLPIYNKPMIMYPLQTLLDSGINQIMIITGPDHAGGFISLLGSGRKLGCRLNFEVQEEPLGIAHAIGLTKDFVGDDNCTVILGDNIFSDNISEDVKSFTSGAKIFLKKVPDPERFGVAEIKENGAELEIISIEEKPKIPKSDYAVTGLYVYDNQLFDIVETLEPSARGELEVTDISNAYLNKNQLKGSIIKGDWTDAGTFESLFKANSLAREISK